MRLQLLYIYSWLRPALIRHGPIIIVRDHIIVLHDCLPLHAKVMHVQLLHHTYAQGTGRKNLTHTHKDSVALDESKTKQFTHNIATSPSREHRPLVPSF